MIKLVSSGKEPVIAGAVEWLKAKGIPASLIRSISLDVEVGQPAKLTVSLYVDEPDDLAEK
jgi:hypothetical protein